ncbi:JHBP domain-containing protein, partial [Salmonella enterica subsp. enterica serovar Typhimurium]|nr:JHBP domain-containing protein [Salmonella enterica subsp. enterica serovar Typhimurium]
FELKGFKDLDINQLDYDSSSSRLDYDLTFTKIDADLDFELLLSGLINLEHHPTAKISLTELKLAGYAVVDTSVEPNQLTDFKLLASLGGSEVELTNILNDDELTENLTE